MSLGGTDAYAGDTGLPPLVACAVEAARASAFALSCRPAHGRLLALLAGGVGDGAIGEIGTGCGVGLAWLASGASPGAPLVSVESDRSPGEAARGVFADDPRVTAVVDEWTALEEHTPFDLLFLDGGGQGKRGEEPVDPARWVRPGGVVVMDDFTPSASWPPTYEGAVDEIRLAWLTNPALLATKIRTAPDAAAIVATRRAPHADS